MTLTERFEKLEEQGWRYIYDGRGFFSGIWRNETLDCILNDCGGSFQTITSAVEAAERFVSNLILCGAEVA
jgi:hypothetical protein